MTDSARRRLERGGLALVALAGIAAWLRWHVEPTFDTAWSLLWGREAIHGVVPTFSAYRAPTEHPLWLGLGILLAPFGDGEAARIATAVGVASLVLLVAAVYRLGQVTFGALAGLVAAVILLTRLDFPFLAAFSFVDVPYLALLVWAAVLEAERPRRGGPVLALLVLAGLLRPEAWGYLIAYVVWLGWRATPRRRLALGALAALPIVLWGLTDLIVTGDPAFSFTFTTNHAQEFDRQRGLVQVPGSTLSALIEYLKWPILAGGVGGIVLAWRFFQPRARLEVPLAMLVLGLASFVVTSAAGFAVIPRYLAFGALPLMVFCAYLFTGFLEQPRGGAARRRWAAGAAVLVVAGGAWQVAHLHPASVTGEFAYRVRVERALREALDAPATVAARRCGPISVPNHKLVPYVRLMTGAPNGAVAARSDPVEAARAARGGAAIYLAGGLRLLDHPAYGMFGRQFRFDDTQAIAVPAPGFVPIHRNAQFVVYARCPRAARAS